MYLSVSVCLSSYVCVTNDTVLWRFDESSSLLITMVFVRVVCTIQSQLRRCFIEMAMPGCKTGARLTPASSQAYGRSGHDSDELSARQLLLPSAVCR